MIRTWKEINWQQYMVLFREDIREISSGKLHGGGFYIEHGTVGRPEIRREIGQSENEQTHYFKLV